MQAGYAPSTERLLLYALRAAPWRRSCRQLAPRLLEGLRGSARKSSKHSVDQELNSIRLEVQVTPKVARRPAAPRAELPRDKLGAVARGLTDSELKRALERICAGLAKPRTR